MKEKLLISACLLGIGCRYDGGRVRKIDCEALLRRYELIPVCPEIYGGLPTPRVPSERVGDRVVMRDGTDVTENYNRGMEHTVMMAETVGARLALLKARSPSCGKDVIYDGSFTSTLTARHGVTAERLIALGFEVYTEDEIDKLLSR